MTRSLSVQQNTSEAGRSYRPGRIRERNREAILQAAEQEFALHGYKGTTIQNIAERAGLPKSNVLYYFSNKKRMYSAMFDDILLRWNKVFSEIKPDDDPATALETFIRTKVNMSQQYPLASRLFAMEIIQGDPVQLIFLIWSSTQHYADFQVQILMVENKAEYEPRDFGHAADFLVDVILRGCGLERPG